MKSNFKELIKADGSGNSDLIEFFLKTLDLEPVDFIINSMNLMCEKEVLKAEEIQNDESIESYIKALRFDEKIQRALLVKRATTEMALVFLFHAIEVKLKTIIKLDMTLSEQNYTVVDRFRWDELVNKLPSELKQDKSYENVSLLKDLVNSIKHSSTVSNKLNKKESKFGEAGEEIYYFMEEPYEYFKKPVLKFLENVYFGFYTISSE